MLACPVDTRCLPGSLSCSGVLLTLRPCVPLAVRHVVLPSQALAGGVAVSSFGYAAWKLP